MPPLPLITPVEEFRREIDDLFTVIQEARKKRISEYEALNRPVPARVRFEELDLGEYKTRMLRVHRTLQWRRYNNEIERHEKKARVVAIAGICELIKDEYVGKFWEVYGKYMEWGPDYTVYDWIWEKGFRQEGVELVKTGRREFIQSLVLESGIPKRRAKEIIDFFTIYWRYFRKYEDTEELVRSVLDSTDELAGLPIIERERFRRLCEGAAEFSKAFALTISKLSRVFQYIEASESLFSDGIENHVEEIYRGCGIDLLEILRDRNQLKALYEKLAGLITPQKLAVILSGQLPGTRIRLPTGAQARTNQYMDFIYGEHGLGDVRFYCVPDTSYSPGDLERLPFDTVIRYGGRVLLKSRVAITAKVNGKERPDLVRPFYTRNPEAGPTFSGNIFSVDLQPAMSVDLSTANSRVRETIFSQDGARCFPELRHYSSPRSNTHNLAIFIPGFRIRSGGLVSRELLFLTSLGAEPIFTVKTDETGAGFASEFIFLIKEPEPGKVRFYPALGHSMKPVSAGGREIVYEVILEESMLFSAYGHWQFRPTELGTPSMFGGKHFVLYDSSTSNGDRPATNNLKVTAEATTGKYKVYRLEWVDSAKPCSVSVAGKHWGFEKCLEYRLFLNKKTSEKPGVLIYREAQGQKPSEFEMVLFPAPAGSTAGEFFWNLVVNDGDPLMTRYKAGPLGHEEGRGTRFDGNDVASIIKGAWNERSGGNASVEISLCSKNMAIASTRFWLLPDVRVIPPTVFADGEDVVLNVACGSRSERRVVPLRDRRGRSGATMRPDWIDGMWNLPERLYTGELEFADISTSIPVQLTPRVVGSRFGRRASGETEQARTISRHELTGLDLIVSSEDTKEPSTIVDKKRFPIVFERSGGLMISSLGQLLECCRKRNTNVTVSAGRINTSFDIISQVEILAVEFEEYLVGGCVVGRLAYRGPEEGCLRVRIFDGKATGKGEEIVRADVACDGDEHVDVPVSVSLGTGGPRGAEALVIKIGVIQDVAGNSPEHEYGDAWTVKPEDITLAEDYESLKRAASSSFRAGKYFLARDALARARMLAPPSEREWLEGFYNNILFHVFQRQIGTIIARAARIMKKEYSIPMIP